MGKTNLLATVLVSVFTLSVGVWGWLMQRWVAKVDSLHRDVASLERQAAVRDERMTHLIGALELLRKSVADLAANQGALTQAVEKMWIVLQTQGLVEPRHSDTILHKRRP
jgi:hypothetical protein